MVSFALSVNIPGSFLNFENMNHPVLPVPGMFIPIGTKHFRNLVQIQVIATHVYVEVIPKREAIDKDNRIVFNRETSAPDYEVEGEFIGMNAQIQELFQEWVIRQFGKTLPHPSQLTKLADDIYTQLEKLTPEQLAVSKIHPFIQLFSESNRDEIYFVIGVLITAFAKNIVDQRVQAQTDQQRSLREQLEGLAEEPNTTN